MRVLYLSDEFPPAVTGGAAIVAYDFAVALLKKGMKFLQLPPVKTVLAPERAMLAGLKFISKY